MLQRVAIQLPREIHTLPIRRPPHLLGRPSVKARPAHDVVDGEIELLRRGSNRNNGKKKSDRDAFHGVNPTGGERSADDADWTQMKEFLSALHLRHLRIRLLRIARSHST